MFEWANEMKGSIARASHERIKNEAKLNVAAKH